MNNKKENDRRYYQRHRSKRLEEAKKRTEIGRQAIIKMREERGNECQICRYNDEPRILVFHHCSDKEFDISQMRSFSVERIKKEIQKCILLCPNCHAIIHAEFNFNKSFRKNKGRSGIRIIN